MLQLRNVSKFYRCKKGEVLALDGVSVDFSEKGLTMVLGKSGCGKSTLLSILAGISGQSSGELIIDGKNTKEFKEKDFDAYRNSYIGLIFQDTNLLENLTVEENILLAADLQNRNFSKPHKKTSGGTMQSDMIESVLERVGLEGYNKRRINELSGGQLQRVSIARAIVKNTKIILADEPTGSLDSRTSDSIFNILKTLAGDRLVIVVTHDRDSVFRYGDRVLEMSDGKIISDLSKTDYAEEACFFDKNNLTVNFPQNRAVTPSELSEMKSCLADMQKEDIEKLNFCVSGQKGGFSETKAEFKRTEAVYSAILPVIPFQFSLKMAFNNIKARKFGLIFTIFTLVLVIALFGIAQIFSGYDINKATVTTFRESGVGVIRALQGEYDDRIYTIKNNGSQIVSDDFYDEFKKTFTDIPIFKEYDQGMTWYDDTFFSMAYGPFCNRLLTIDTASDLITLGYNGIKYGNYLNDSNTKNSGVHLEVLVSELWLYITLLYNPLHFGGSFTMSTYDYFLEFMRGEIEKLPPTDRDWVLGFEPDAMGGILNEHFYLNTSGTKKLMKMFEPFTEKLAEFIINTHINYDDIYCTHAFKYKVVGMIDTGLAGLLPGIKETNNENDRGAVLDYDEYVNRHQYSSFAQMMVCDRETFENYRSFAFLYTQKPYIEVTGGGKSSEKTFWNFHGYNYADKNNLSTLCGDIRIEMLSGYLAGCQMIWEEYNILKYTIRASDGSVGLKPDDVIITYEDFLELFGKDVYIQYFQSGGQNYEDLYIYFQPLGLKSKLLHTFKLRVAGVIFPYEYDESNVYLVSDETLSNLFLGYAHYPSYFIPLTGKDAETVQILNLLQKYEMFHASKISEPLYTVDTLMKTIVGIFEIIIIFAGILGVLQIYNFTTHSVKKRTKEIGILRALGASSSNVIKIFLSEVLAVVIIAAAIGTALVAVSATVLNSILLENSAVFTKIIGLKNIALLSLNFKSVALTLLFCFGLAAICALTPSVAVSRMKPFDAIRKLNTE